MPTYETQSGVLVEATLQSESIADKKEVAKKWFDKGQYHWAAKTALGQSKGGVGDGRVVVYSKGALRKVMAILKHAGFKLGKPEPDKWMADKYTFTVSPNPGKGKGKG